MFAPLGHALADLSAPPLRRIVVMSLGLAVIAFAVLWLALAAILEQIARFGWPAIDWLLQSLGLAAVLVLSWLLFPAVVTLIMGFFLTRIAGEVEAVDYPGRPPPREQPLGEGIVVTLRMMAITIALNLAALPAYILAPGANFFVFLGLNGYLLGREYFEVVALRRLDAQGVRMVRRRFRGRVFAGGVVIAGLFLLPLVNLIAPVIATAFMVHLFERLPRLESRATVS
jgi:uncharacterized protein involved in cysteine biosynthesis